MRYLLLFAPLLVSLVEAGAARAETDEPTTDPVASNAFIVRLTPDVSRENVTQQILEAGHDQLAAACEASPTASLRIFNPLATGSYEDVLCSTILDGGESIGQSSEPVTSGGSEHIGQSQQKWSIFGLGCTAFVALSALFVNYALCNHPGAEQPDACHAVNDAGFFGLGLMCNFL